MYGHIIIVPMLEIFWAYAGSALMCGHIALILEIVWAHCTYSGMVIRARSAWIKGLLLQMFNDRTKYTRF